MKSQLMLFKHGNEKLSPSLFCLIIAFPKLLSLHIKPSPFIRVYVGTFIIIVSIRFNPEAFRYVSSLSFLDIIESSCEKRAILILFTLLKISNSFHIIKGGAMKSLKWRQIEMSELLRFCVIVVILRQDTGLL